MAYHIMGYEKNRTGSFSVALASQTNVRLYGANPLCIFYGSGTDLGSNFNFDIDIIVEGNKIGKMHFDFAEIKETMFGHVNMVCDTNPEITMEIIIGYSLPLKCKMEGHIDVEFPEKFLVGHRGSGSNPASHEFLENTIPGFLKAYERGANVIEFDIQLAVDKTPVIFHDFSLVRDEKYDGFEPIKVKKNGKFCYAWNQLSVEQHRVCGQDTEFKCDRCTFKEIIEKVPHDLPFDIEIKYPFSKRFEGKIPYPERNEFLERVFEEMQMMGDRKAFLSTFCPVLCTMLTTKQHKYDVYQLIVAEKDETHEYYVNKIRALAPLHKELGIKGFISESDHLLQSPELVKELTDMGFEVHTYGRLNNDVKYVKEQLDLGVRGICTDHLEVMRPFIDEYMSKK